MITFYIPASGSASWQAPADGVVSAVTSSIDGLLTLDPDGTWLDYVTQAGPKSVEQTQVLLRSVYSSLGDPHPMFQLNNLAIDYLQGQKIFVSAGNAAGLVQLFCQDLATI